MRQVFLALFLLSGNAFGVTRHYLYLFAFDDGKQTPEKSHTYAAYFKVDFERVNFENLENRDGITFDSISWLPRSGNIVTLRPGPERGVNTSMKDSFNFVKDAHKKESTMLFAQWGPYEIELELFDLSLKQAKDLRDGKFWYQVIDNKNRIFKVLDPANNPLPRAMMCVHAVSDTVLPVDLDPKKGRGFLLTGKLSGIPGTKKVLHHLSPWLLGDSRTGYLTPVDPKIKAKMDGILELRNYPKIVKHKIETVPTDYCKTLEACRKKTSSFMSFGPR